MRYSVLSSLAIPALVLASPPVHGPAKGLEAFLQERSIDEAERTMLETVLITHAPTITPAPTFAFAPEPTATSSGLSRETLEPQENILELRQAAGNDNLGTTLANTAQAATVTTAWLPTQLTDGGETWVEVIYTQTFASVPDQWETSGSGSIGLGTITGTVGIVKTEKSSAMSLMPSGSFVTVTLGMVGIVSGMGMILL